MAPRRRPKTDVEYVPKEHGVVNVRREFYYKSCRWP